MRKPWFFLPLASVLIFVLDGFAQDKVNAPVFQDGDYWHFKSKEWDWLTKSSTALNGIYEISYLNGRVRIFELNSEQKIELRSPQPSALLVLLGLSKNPGYQDLKFPFFAEHKWNYEPSDQKRNQKLLR